MDVTKSTFTVTPSSISLFTVTSHRSSHRSKAKLTIAATYLETVADRVDRQHILPSIILHGAGEEGLRKEETRYPEHHRNPVIHPVGEKHNTSL